MQWVNIFTQSNTYKGVLLRLLYCRISAVDKCGLQNSLNILYVYAAGSPKVEYKAHKIDLAVKNKNYNTKCFTKSELNNWLNVKERQRRKNGKKILNSNVKFRPLTFDSIQFSLRHK